MSIRETFLKKYGIWEYIFLVAGLLILGTLVYWFMTKQLENSIYEGIALIVSIFMIAAPQSLLNWGRKKVGLKTKEEA